MSVIGECGRCGKKESGTRKAGGWGGRGELTRMQKGGR